jgi:hypothetical protein
MHLGGTRGSHLFCSDREEWQLASFDGSYRVEMELRHVLAFQRRFHGGHPDHALVISTKSENNTCTNPINQRASFRAKEAQRKGQRAVVRISAMGVHL